jgi:hypothetical protein
MGLRNANGPRRGAQRPVREPNDERYDCAAFSDFSAFSDFW